MFKMTLDKIFPPPKEQETYMTGASLYPLEPFPDNRNLW